MKFETPKFEIQLFATEDIMTASATTAPSIDNMLDLG